MSRRTGQNLSETIPTPANVNAAQFGKLYLSKSGWLRLSGQPLYVPDVQLTNGTMHNVVYVATQHDSVYAFDADNDQGSNATPLWTVNLGKSVPKNTANYGCGGTPTTPNSGSWERR